MFTGIVENTGAVESVQKNRFSIQTPWNSNEIHMGQSICIQGCCLTVMDIQNQTLSFDVSDETLGKTFFGKIQKGQKLNLERAMKMDSRFDGHWVTGHVDTVGTIGKITSAGENSRIFTIEGLKDHQMHLVPKGSIAIDGVSLTINEVFDGGVAVNIIPYTYKHTCFSFLKENDPVHVEFDVMGKYLMKYIQNYQQLIRNSRVGN